MQHPLLANRSSLLYYAAIWAIFGLLEALVLRYLFSGGWPVVLLDGVGGGLLYGVMGLSFWYPCRYISLEKSGVPRILLNHLITAFAAAAIWVGIGYATLLKVAPATAGYASLFAGTIPWRLSIGVLLYFVLAGFYYLLIYYHNFHEKALQEARLATLIKEAELRTLKFQINPHFIYNSLNSINALILSAPENASRMTVKLGAFLRSTFAQNETGWKPLSEELSTARLYMEIERIRFGDRFRYEEQVDAAHHSIPVPNMLLQPVFENAIKHGVQESLEVVTIRLKTTLQNGFLQLVIRNNFDPQAGSRRGAGVGLQNIRDRLVLIYGDRHRFRAGIINADCFEVAIHIPVNTNGKERRESKPIESPHHR